jgi:hypothetical protein
MPLTEFQMAMMKADLLRSWAKVQDLRMTTRSGRTTDDIIYDTQINNHGKISDFILANCYILPHRSALGFYDKQWEKEIEEETIDKFIFGDDPDFEELNNFNTEWANHYYSGVRVKI